MRKRKVVKKFVYEGLGFPVILSDAPLIEVRVWTLDMDYNSLMPDQITFVKRLVRFA